MPPAWSIGVDAKKKQYSPHSQQYEKKAPAKPTTFVVYSVNNILLKNQKLYDHENTHDFIHLSVFFIHSHS